MNNWNRQYRLVAKRSGETGFEIGEPGSDGRAIHISFSIEKTSEATSYSSASITLWNLNETQRAIIMPNQDDTGSENCTITLSAGYGEDVNKYYTIFKGQVSKATEEIDGADRRIDIEAVDLVPTLKTTVVSLSYTKSVTCLQVINDLSSKLGLSASDSTLKFSASAEKVLESAYFTGGFSYIGYAQNVLNKICGAVSTLSWSVANGVLYIRYGDESITTSVYHLDASTGLIGIPKRKYSTSTTSDSTSASYAIYGYEITYLLNGAFGCGEYISLESELVKGTFLVSTISMSGDNVSGDWTCSASIVESSSVTNVTYSNEES